MGTQKEVVLDTTVKEESQTARAAPPADKPPPPPVEPPPAAPAEKSPAPADKPPAPAKKQPAPAAPPAEPAASPPEPVAPPPKPLSKADRQILLGEKLLGQGDFEGAIRANMEALSLSPKGPPGDEALFNMGLLYAHNENPEKDYKKSLEYFGRLVQDYPKSPLKEQAKIWVGVLEVIEKSKQVDIEIEMKKKELGR